jgi:ERF superfamily
MADAKTAEIVATDQHHPFPGESQEIQPITPMELMQLALTKGADINQLEKLMDLQLRWEANEAKKAFVQAMNDFKANPPEIIKNKTVSFKDTTYKHATLDEVCDKITKSLSEHGISHRWSVAQSEGLIKVTCILTHRLGHSEQTTLCGGPDTTGSKNAIQAISSTVTYLERYTLFAATGLAAQNDDNDGRGAEPQMEKLQEYLDSIATCPNLESLQATFKAGFQEAVKLQNSSAMKALSNAKDAKKTELLKETAA